MLIRTTRLIALACIGFTVGCGPSQTTDHNAAADKPTNETPGEHPDPHDLPLTDADIDKLRDDTARWSAAIERIQNARDTIQTETTEGTPAKAHRSLDLVDYVLQWLPEIAQTNNVPKDDWQSVGENTQTLRDAFNEVHANIDAGSAPGYESVAAEIDAAVEALAAIEAGESNGKDSPE